MELGSCGIWGNQRTSTFLERSFYGMEILSLDLPLIQIHCEENRHGPSQVHLLENMVGEESENLQRARNGPLGGRLRSERPVDGSYATS